MSIFGKNRFIRYLGFFYTDLTGKKPIIPKFRDLKKVQSAKRIMSHDGVVSLVDKGIMSVSCDILPLSTKNRSVETLVLIAICDL